MESANIALIVVTLIISISLILLAIYLGMRCRKKRNLEKFLEDPNDGVRESYDFPVDAVISWVDVNDPEWRKSKELYSGEKEGSEDKFRFNSASCNDCELYICVQLILRNIPWIRTIFIACTRPQKPAFFNDLEIQKLVKKGKLKLVYHDQFFSDKSDLPTFNSCAIEANIQNIPGLSDNFLYFNDDFYIIKPMEKKHFFVNRKPKPFITKSGVIKKTNLWSHTWNNFHNAEEEKGFKSHYMVEHTPHPLNKRIMNKTKKMYKNLWELTSKSRFRSKVGIPPIGASISYHINIENGKYTDLSSIESILLDVTGKNSFKGIGKDTCFVSIGFFDSENTVKMLKELSELYRLEMSKNTI